MITWYSKVEKVEAKKRALRAVKTGRTIDGQEEVNVEYENLGHGLLLEGEWQWHIFKDPPPFQAGDKVKVTIEKVT